MPIRTELNLRLPNSPGAVARVCRLLADEHVNVLALMVESTGQLHLVVDNHVHAAGVLEEHHFQVVRRDVLFVGLANAPGALAPVLRLLADADVNLDYAYAGAGETSAGAAVVIGVPDALRASAAAGV